MYIYVYTDTYTYIYIHTHIRTYAHIHMYFYSASLPYMYSARLPALENRSLLICLCVYRCVSYCHYVTMSRCLMRVRVYVCVQTRVLEMHGCLDQWIPHGIAYINT